MKYRFEIRLLSESAILELSDEKDRTYIVEIGPKKSAEYFSILFREGASQMEDVTVSAKGLPERRLGEALCHIVLFEDHGLFKCSTPSSGESRNLEIYPRVFAQWLANCLESRPKTQVGYEIFD